MSKFLDNHNVSWIDFNNKSHKLKNFEVISSSVKRIYSQYLLNYFTEKYLEDHFYKDITLLCMELMDLDNSNKSNEIINMKLDLLYNRLSRVISELDKLSLKCVINSNKREKELNNRSYRSYK